MNNILTFEDYRKMNIRQVESVIYRQFIDADIKDEVNEGIIRKAINKAASNFIQTALADEIEKGKELEKSIKAALDGLDKGFEDIKKKIDVNADSKSKLAAIEKVKEAIKAVQSQAFDTLTMLGSSGEIDFAGFMGSGTVAAVANFGILFSPVRSLFITRKAYKYFIGIIKQTIRRNLLIIQLNFDQFENLILQKSFETEDDSEMITKNNTLHEIIGAMQKELVGKDSKLKMFTGKKGREMTNYLDVFKKTQEALYKERKERDRHNPLSSLWSDQHNNTYTRTLEQIRQYINDDSQKELDALKNSISKMSGNDPDLIPYGELMISAAEEYAIHTNHGINNNFIKMSSVFNLENQKKLIELITETQKENEEEINKKLKEQKLEDKKKIADEEIETGKEIYEKEIKSSTDSFTFDTFEEKIGDDAKYLRAYFMSDDGKDDYKEFSEKNPEYKYFIGDITALNDLYESINALNIVEIPDIDEFYKNIVNEEQALYYMMADQSIKDAVKSVKSADYFGFKGVTDSKVDGNILTCDDIDKKKIVESIFTNKTILNKSGRRAFVPKSKYFLNFNVSRANSLFNILHNIFKTEIFKETDSEYNDNISIESKETIMKLIHKNLKVGKSIASQFAEYLVRLEMHMLLESQKPWFVIKNNDKIKDCFNTDDEAGIQNKTAFVEVSSSDYEEMKAFLTKFKNLYNNDFSDPEEKDNKNNDK